MEAELEVPEGEALSLVSTPPRIGNTTCRPHGRRHVLYTVARARGGVRNTSGITPKRQARGGAHLGLHCSHRVPQVGTSPRAQLSSDG